MAPLTVLIRNFELFNIFVHVRLIITNINKWKILNAYASMLTSAW